MGKNYLPNSQIKYEYYDNGIHASYPDFVMKDRQDRLHIFEVKSLNNSKNQHLSKDDPEYKQKIGNLINLYTEVSKLLTDYYFYIPIKYGSDWEIHRMHNNINDTLTLTQFENFLINNK
ncbi:MAG: hypothetical protein KBT47_07240 [Armatimonadetes bacterium]|nr:hypothetical protein [Candidatus Hippobium faecium]